MATIKCDRCGRDISHLTLFNCVATSQTAGRKGKFKSHSCVRGYNCQKPFAKFWRWLTGGK